MDAMTDSMLTTAVKALIAKHGGVRPAARVLGINYAYLSRLGRGEKSNPTPAVLRKLGLKKVVSYEPIRKMRTVLSFPGGELELS